MPEASFKRFVTSKALAKTLGLLEIAYRPLGLDKSRMMLGIPAGGDLLEVGSGTGSSLAGLLNASTITLLEPDVACVAALKERVVRLGVKERVTIIDTTVGQALDRGILRPASFDQVVFSFSLCSIEDPLHSLTRLKNVLKADGKIYFIEHTCTTNPKFVQFQSGFAPIWTSATGGCRLNSDPLKLLEDAGFHPESRAFRRPMGWPFFKSGVIGSASSTQP